MRYLIKFIIVSMLIIKANDLKACICGELPSVDKYDYIALVEITGILKSDLYKFSEKDELPNPIFHEIKVKTLEQFVGENQDFLIISGGNHKYNIGWTSCDMGMEIGEKWILYGNKFKRKVSTSYCSLSIKHMNSKDEIDYKYNRSISRIKNLKYKFQSKKKEKNIGKIEFNYINGKPKLTEEYDSNGNLRNSRKAYYNNGQLMVDEFYKDGLKHGNVTWYYENGNVDRSSIFREGKEICETYLYNYKGKLKRINFYDDEGNFITYKKNFN